MQNIKTATNNTESNTASGIAARKQSGMAAVNLGLVANIFLASIKTSIGIIGTQPRAAR